jgi:hypothetical protein
LESYISTPLRERLYLNWADRDYLRTLPKWMVLAKNRRAVLKGIKALKQKLLDA